jgi:dTDP-4-dehydrorhamnose reductase
MKEQKILILGSNGQLGKQFQTTLAARKIEALAPNEQDCDITEFTKLNAYILQSEPTIIVNCAAYNAVDEAEKDNTMAFQINHLSVLNLAKICSENNIRLVHYSSDYVFDGKKGALYTEEDIPNPLNEYGKSKLAGENAVLENAPNGLVLRLSWVFGDGKQNFLYKLKNWALNNSELKISADETSVPTSTVDTVQATLTLLENKETGLFHMTNSGYCSRYEWARFALEHLNMKNTIIPVSMSNFRSPADRPLFSAMSNEKILERLDYDIPSWKDSTANYLKK